MSSCVASAHIVHICHTCGSFLICLELSHSMSGVSPQEAVNVSGRCLVDLWEL